MIFQRDKMASQPLIHAAFGSFACSTGRRSHSEGGGIFSAPCDAHQIRLLLHQGTLDLKPVSDVKNGLIKVERGKALSSWKW